MEVQGLYMVCPSCGRVTAVDTGYCRHCRAPLFGLVFEAPEEAREFEVRVGVDCEGVPVGFRLGWLRRHLLVVGLTGYGKTTFVKRLLVGLWERGVGFLVVDWDGEYRDLAEGLGVKRVDVLSEDAGLDPFWPCGVSARDHAEWLAGVLCDLYAEEWGEHLSPQMRYALHKAVRKVVEEGGGFRELVRAVEEVCADLPGGRLTAMALTTRFERLAEGAVARAFRGRRRLLSRPLVLDVSGLATQSPWDARFLALLVLRRVLLEGRRWGEARGLRFVVVVEEAEEVAPRRGFVARAWTPVRFLLGMRKRGVGLVLVTHSPSLVDEGLLKSVANVVCFRVIDRRDARVAASLLGLDGDEWRRLGSLGVGEALVRTAASSACFLVRVDRPEYPRLSGAALRLLESIRRNPLLSVRERRAALGMSGAEFREALEELLSRGLVREYEVYTGRGRPVKIYAEPSAGESALHKYGVAVVVRTARKVGLECRVSTSPDVEVEGGLAVEIETGTNISTQKYARNAEKYDVLLIVPVTRKAYRQLQRIELPPNARVVRLSELDNELGAWIRRKSLRACG